ncbi:MAG TPA: VTT domain-containing protein, partial [Fimbriimonadaceae bacterium]|nr:VTT domain-containing protein [Fimbriimonadaceae bacterium]
PKTVILARWIPIVRTFSPFVAGMGSMSYRTFLSYSIIGAVLWVWTLVGAGYLLGRNPWVQENFEWVMILMIVVTGGPVVIEVLKRRYYARKYAEKPSLADPPTTGEPES